MPDMGRWFNVDPLAELSPDLSPFRYAFNNPVSVTDPTGMYEDSYYDDSDRQENDNDRLLYWNWLEGARNPDADNVFEKVVLAMLDIINGDFRIDSDLKGDGDGGIENDMFHDMAQENIFGMGDNDGGLNAEDGEGPGPKLKPASAYDYSKEIIPGKMTDDWNYILNGNNGNPFSRFGEVLSRDWSAASVGDRFDIVTSAAPVLRPLKLGKLVLNTTARAENAIQLTFRSDISAAKFYKLMNPAASKLHLPQGFKSANGVKWQYYKGGTTNANGWTIKGVTPNNQTPC